MVVVGCGLPGNPYRLLASGDVSAPVATWTSLTSDSFNAEGAFSFTDNGAATIQARFYRLSSP
jgi:hypothetical protein